ncbi:hypothetical protein J7E73_11180 [Paenibacillus albidus]|uniref:hypothetical protein n=1 Tax=Paenibacillus albidus TaxID=2041023 RepID=UPI001BE90E1E|nr:hypothetical protein [Paenibacillus albidus]MBT2289687.1 hypothetical protein [Paenibacillus albidus]
MKALIRKVSRLCAGLLLIGVVSQVQVQQVTAQQLAAAPDVSSNMTVLGSPFKKAPYARNVWDMQLFDGKIYLGHGNSSNNAPSSNAGPVPIYYWDPAQNKFSVQDVTYTNPATGRVTTNVYVMDEQIDSFKVLNGELYIPGHDSRVPGWAYGNFYRLNGDHWDQYMNIPGGIHVYDMAYYKGKLYAALGATAGPLIYVSSDQGSSWAKFDSVSQFGIMRAYNLFELGDKLFASSATAGKTQGIPNERGYMTSISQAGSGAIQTAKLNFTSTQLFPGLSWVVNKNEPNVPGVSGQPWLKLLRTTPVNDRLLYIPGIIYNDHQSIPQGLFSAGADFQNVRKEQLPNTAVLPIDILERGEKVYVLGYVKEATGQYTNYVYSKNTGSFPSTGQGWSEVFHFQRDTFARSFEELNGDFYFGLGSYADVIPASTGTILKLSAGAY